MASEKYLKALAEANAASKVFRFVQQQYRARVIDDAEFLAARKVYKDSDQLLDAAFALEAES